MPSSREGLARPELAPPQGLVPGERLLTCRFTGEVFREYSDYLAALRRYAQRSWTSAPSGRSGLSFEEAAAEEARVASARRAFPREAEGAALRLVHGFVGPADELCRRVLRLVRGDLFPGEEVVYADRREGADAAAAGGAAGPVMTERGGGGGADGRETGSAAALRAPGHGAGAAASSSDASPPPPPPPVPSTPHASSAVPGPIRVVVVRRAGSGLEGLPHPAAPVEVVPVPPTPAGGETGGSSEAGAAEAGALGLGALGALDALGSLGALDALPPLPRSPDSSSSFAGAPSAVRAVPFGSLSRAPGALAARLTAEAALAWLAAVSAREPVGEAGLSELCWRWTALPGLGRELGIDACAAAEQRGGREGLGTKGSNGGPGGSGGPFSAHGGGPMVRAGVFGAAPSLDSAKLSPDVSARAMAPAMERGSSSLLTPDTPPSHADGSLREGGSAGAQGGGREGASGTGTGTGNGSMDASLSGSGNGVGLARLADSRGAGAWGAAVGGRPLGASPERSGALASSFGFPGLSGGARSDLQSGPSHDATLPASSDALSGGSTGGAATRSAASFSPSSLLSSPLPPPASAPAPAPASAPASAPAPPSFPASLPLPPSEARALAQADAQLSEARRRLVELSSRPPPPSNAFKCPRCHRSAHADRSPLLLCDTCSRSFHAACVSGLSELEALPEGSWSCPRCVEARRAAERRVRDAEARRNAVLERAQRKAVEGKAKADAKRTRRNPRGGAESAGGPWAAAEAMDGGRGGAGASPSLAPLMAPSLASSPAFAPLPPAPPLPPATDAEALERARAALELELQLELQPNPELDRAGATPAASASPLGDALPRSLSAAHSSASSLSSDRCAPPTARRPSGSDAAPPTAVASSRPLGGLGSSRLARAVAGPPPPPPPAGARPDDAAALGEAASVAEFLRLFGAVCGVDEPEARQRPAAESADAAGVPGAANAAGSSFSPSPAPTAGASRGSGESGASPSSPSAGSAWRAALVLGAAASPLGSEVLRGLYHSLLAVALLELHAREPPLRPRARRWSRVLSDASWPEVLRRYLCATRRHVLTRALRAVAKRGLDAAPDGSHEKGARDERDERSNDGGESEGGRVAPSEGSALAEDGSAPGMAGASLPEVERLPPSTPPSAVPAPRLPQLGPLPSALRAELDAILLERSDDDAEETQRETNGGREPRRTHGEASMAAKTAETEDVDAEKKEEPPGAGPAVKEEASLGSSHVSPSPAGALASHPFSPRPSTAPLPPPPPVTSSSPPPPPPPSGEQSYWIPDPISPLPPVTLSSSLRDSLLPPGGALRDSRAAAAWLQRAPPGAALALSSDAAALLAGRALGAVPWHRLPPALHLRVLNALAHDVGEGHALREELGRRLAETAQLAAKRAKELAAQRKRAAALAAGSAGAAGTGGSGNGIPTPRRGGGGGRPRRGAAAQAQAQAQAQAPLAPLETESSLSASAPSAQPSLRAHASVSSLSGMSAPSPRFGDAGAWGSLGSLGSGGPAAAAAATQPTSPQPASPRPPGGGVGLEPGHRPGPLPPAHALDDVYADPLRTILGASAAAAAQSCFTPGSPRALSSSSSSYPPEPSPSSRRLEALEAALERASVRVEPLGRDRHGRSYWWLPSSSPFVHVLDLRGRPLGALQTPADLVDLALALLPQGPHEGRLVDALARKAPRLLEDMARWGNEQVRLSTLVEQERTRTEEAEEKEEAEEEEGDAQGRSGASDFRPKPSAEGSPHPPSSRGRGASAAEARRTVASAAARLEAFVRETSEVGVDLVESAAAQAERELERAVDAGDERALRSALALLEAAYGPAGEGLPPHAADDDIAPYLAGDGHPPEDDGVERDAAGNARKTKGEDDDDDEEEDDDEDDDEEEEEDDDAGEGASRHLAHRHSASSSSSALPARASASSLPSSALAPLPWDEELDDSEAEHAYLREKRMRRPARLWRSGRERAAWLRAARAAPRAEGAAWAAMLLVDRAGPMLQRCMALAEENKKWEAEERERREKEKEEMEKAAAEPGARAAAGLGRPVDGTGARTAAGPGAVAPAGVGGASGVGVSPGGSSAVSVAGAAARSALGVLGVDGASSVPLSRPMMIRTGKARTEEGIKVVLKAMGREPFPSGRAASTMEAASPEVCKRCHWSYQCSVCLLAGDLLCCEHPNGCSVAVHLECSGAPGLPPGPWICANHDDRQLKTRTRRRGRATVNITALEEADEEEEEEEEERKNKRRGREDSEDDDAWETKGKKKKKNGNANKR